MVPRLPIKLPLPTDAEQEGCFDSLPAFLAKKQGKKTEKMEEIIEETKKKAKIRKSDVDKVFTKQ